VRERERKGRERRERETERERDREGERQRGREIERERRREERGRKGVHPSGLSSLPCLNVLNWPSTKNYIFFSHLHEWFQSLCICPD
jgi:hypothetical protein